MPERPSIPERGSTPERHFAPRARSIFIAAFLLLQVALPLSYYLGDAETDERFAWRMFSAVRVQSCSVSVEEIVDGGGGETVRPLSLTETIHKAWESSLERNRPAVVEKLFSLRCARDDVKRVQMQRTCRDAAGGTHAELFSRSCDGAAIVRSLSVPTRPEGAR